MRCLMRQTVRVVLWLLALFPLTFPVWDAGDVLAQNVALRGEYTLGFTRTCALEGLPFDGLPPL